MAIKNKQNQNLKRDPKKDRIFRQLADVLEQQGISVRREQLRRGQGWKASSGSCVLKSANLILIDSALVQDDQIEILIGCLKDLKLSYEQTWLSELPVSIRSQLVESLQQAA